MLLRISLNITTKLLDSNFMKNKKANILLLTILLLNVVNADNRRYVWTYEYITMEPGKAELEHYLTFEGKDRMHTKDAVKVVHNLELEIGMNERFDVGIYQDFSQSPGKAFQYDGYKMRMRYRIGEKGQYLVDPLLYFEYKGNTDFSKHVYEGKLILARDFGSVNAAVNPVFEIEMHDGKTETMWKYNAGLSKRLNSLLSVGLEFRGDREHQYLGPVISHGRDGLWIAFGTAFAITNVSEGVDPFKIRMIIGIHF